MSNAMLAESAKEKSPPQADKVLVRLANFHMLRNQKLRTVSAWIPGLLLLLILVDWLVGQGMYSRDIFITMLDNPENCRY